MTKHGFSTRTIHEDGLIEPAVPSHPSSTPIYQTAGFSFDSLGEIDQAIDRASAGDGTSFFYSRVGNPTVDACERLLASLESAEGATAYASGMAAIFGALSSVLKPGDHIVAPKSLYGGSYGIFNGLFAEYGVETTYVPVHDLTAWEDATRSNTKVYWAESIANPTLEVVDMSKLGGLAKDKGAKLIVDSTFATPYVFRPLEHGADLVVHSATKYLGGHGDVLGGFVAGDEALMGDVKKRLFQVGGNMSPFVAWLILRAMKTLSLRMDRHMGSAMKVAQFLVEDDRAGPVRYPGLKQSDEHARAAAFFEHGFGAMISVELPGGDDAARRFVDRLSLFKTAGSLGDPHSLAIPPAAASHRFVPEAERHEMGIGPGFVRLSIGLEDVTDLVADLDAALG